MLNLLKCTLVLRLLKARPFKGRSRLLMWLASRTRYVPTYYGPVIVSNPQDYTNKAAIFGNYGDWLADIIRKLPKDGVFLDIGANLGIYSLLSAAHLDRGQVFSFEPNQTVFAHLVENIKINHLGNITAMNCGISTQTQVQFLASDPNHTGAGNISDTGLPILLIDSKELARIAEVTHNRRTLCKIDTEGFELQILKSLAGSEMLAHIDQLFIEINDTHLQRYGGSESGIYTLLREHGFTLAKRSDGVEHYDAHFLKES